MKKIFFITLFFISLFSQAQISFQKTYPSGIGQSIQQTNDSGFIFAASEWIQGKQSEISLNKINSNGSIEWQKTFGTTSDDYANEIKITKDGGYIISGYTILSSNNFKTLLLKTSSDGTLQWSKTFARTNIDEGFSVQQTSDEGYIVGGLSGKFAGGMSDAFLLKTNSDGNLQWSKTLGGNGDEVFRSSTQAADGEYIFIGETSSFGLNSFDIYITKTSSDGNPSWIKTYGTSNLEDGFYIQQTADMGFIICGYTQFPPSYRDDIYLLKIDSVGSVEWSKSFGTSDDDDGISVKQSIDGGYIVSGITGYFLGPRYPYLLKTDSNGSLLWAKKYGGTSNSISSGGYLLQTNDNGFIQLATISTTYLIKTDSIGYSGCNENNLVLNDSIVNTSVANQIIQSSFGWTATNANLQQANNNISETILCFANGVNDFQNKNSEINIFPNPFSSETQIQVSGSQSSVIGGQFILFDVFGRAVYQSPFTDNRLLLKRGNLSSGIYFYKVSSGEKIIGTGKIIAE